MAGPSAAEADPRAAERLKRRLRIINQMKQIKHKLIVGSGKGGVGKSTVATNLALELARRGHKVGLLDMDLTGPNVPTMLGLRGAAVGESEAGGLIPVKYSENLSVISMQFLLQEQDQAIVWRGPIKMQVIQQFLGDVEWGALDYLVVDLPPGSSDEPLSVAQNIPEADGFILVTTPQEVSVGDVRKSVSFANKLEIPILGVIENMSGLPISGYGEPNSTVTIDTGVDKIVVPTDKSGHFLANLAIFPRDGGKAMADKLGIAFLGAIPMDLRLNRLADAGKSILDQADSPATIAIVKIVDGLQKL